MIELITGKPGAGKTYWVVTRIISEVQKGRVVYSDIEGLAIDGVLPAPEDWRTAPAGALVVYDEVQKVFGPDQRQGRSTNPIIADLETHRHKGIDLWLITQHPNLLHAHVRRLIGTHHHVVAVYNSSYQRVYSAGELIDVDKPHMLLECDCQSFVRDKTVFQRYRSTVQDTTKVRLPKKTLRLLAVLVLGAAVLAWAIPQSVTSFEARLVEPTFTEPDYPEHLELPVEEIPTPQIFQPPPPPPQRRSRRIEVAPAGCMSMGERCLCFDATGRRMAVDIGVCLAVVELPGRPTFISSR